jgi:hypothetical protein
MALTFSVVDRWDDGKRIHASGTIAATGNYTTGGDTLDLSQVALIASDQPKVQGTGWMDGLAGYDYVFTPGVAMNSNKVKIFQQGSAAGAFPELAAGANPGAITADTITAGKVDPTKTGVLTKGSVPRRRGPARSHMSPPLLRSPGAGPH